MTGRFKGIDVNKGSFRQANDDDLDHQMFAQNIKAWDRHFTQVAEIFSNMNSTESYLLINDAGDFDICFRGKPLFGMGSRKWALQGLKNYFGSIRIINQVCEAEGAEADVLKRIATRVENIRCSPLPPNPVGPQCYHLAVFGFALGDHVPLAVDFSKCHNLILVEPNIEFLYLSLFTFDWESLFREFSTSQKRLQIILNENPEDIELRIRDCLYPISPQYFDGTTIIKSYECGKLDAILGLIKGSSRFVKVAAGFFEDERDMMRNACLNLRNYNGRYYKRRNGQLPLPAFIVGSGPSLDENIDVIRDNQDRTAIVSCGTALKILLKNGIIPDFHEEMENTPEIADLVASEAKSHDISSIVLIASYTVVPEVAKHFTTSVYYFRPNLAPTPIFSLGKDAYVEYATPTVANLGFSFAQEFGFTDIYMFGVDLGARDIERHHAEGSAYHDGEVEVPYEDILDIPMPANFGGEDILTDAVFVMAKDSLQQALHRFPTERNYYNCSDGMRIDGMNPLRGFEISLPEQSPKRHIIKEAVSSFPRYSSDEFRNAWNKEDRVSLIKDFRDRLLSFLDPKTSSGTEPQPDQYTVKLDAAFHAHVKGDQDKAIQLCEDASRLEPERYEHLFMFGLITMSFNNTELAISFMEEGRKLAPNCREFADALSQLCSKSGKHAESNCFSKSAYTMESDPLLARYLTIKLSALTVFDHDYMVKFNDRFYQTAGKMTVENHYYKGSLLFPLSAVYFYAIRTPPGKIRDQIIEIGRQEIERHINLIADQVLELYDSLEPD